MSYLAPGHAALKFHPLANLFPMLSDIELADLADDIKANGQAETIKLHKGMILDGRNRYRACALHSLGVRYEVFEGSDRQALNFVCSKNLNRRHLSDDDRLRIAANMQKLKLGANQHSNEAPPIGQPSQLFEDAPAVVEQDAPLSMPERAELLKVSERSLTRADTLYSDKGSPELQQAFEAGKVSISTAADIAAALPKEDQAKVAALSEKEILSEAKRIRKEANDKRRTERVEKLKAQSAGNTELSTQRKFAVIYMDPPTKFEAGDSDRSTENHYPTMTEEELAALPVSDLALADAVLFIWTTVPWLRKTIRLLEGYGFEYVSEFVWDKETLGLGFWNRNVHETLLVATRGSMPAPDPTVLERSLYSETRTRHSAKPAKFREIISIYYPDLPKVELFPRIDGALPDGWFGWGNEARVPKQQGLGLEGEEAAA